MSDGDTIDRAEPSPLQVRIERRGRVSVAVPLRQVPALTAEEVEETRAEVRSRRVAPPPL
jgi:hypothetical protein